AELSLLDVSAKTHIRHDIIELLENNDFENAPAPVYTRSYVRKLAELYNLPADAIVEQYTSLINSKRKSTPIDNAGQVVPKVIDENYEPEQDYLFSNATAPVMSTHQRSSKLLKTFIITAVCLIATYLFFNLISGEKTPSTAINDNKPLESITIEVKPKINTSDLLNYAGKVQLEPLKLPVPTTKKQGN
ncbi:MAG: helix-turn-helix domain-containing protein, partial [Lentisphaeria bacterium]